MFIEANVETQAITFNNIGIIYDPLCVYAKLMIQEYYSGPEYDDTVYLLTPSDVFDCDISRPLTRDIIRQWLGRDFKRIVFWNFDHLNWQHYIDRLNQYLEALQPDEIWEWQYENVIGGKYTLQDRVKFVPLRYVSAYEKFRIDKYQDQNCVCHFIGNITPRRTELFNSFYCKFLNFKLLCGRPIYSCIDEISRSGFALNIHGGENNYREQLRISENICLGIPVMMENDDHPYYPGLVEQFDYNWALNNPRDFFKHMSRLYNLRRIQDNANEYKQMTQSEYAYEVYKSNIIKTY